MADGRVGVGYEEKKVAVFVCKGFLDTSRKEGRITLYKRWLEPTGRMQKSENGKLISVPGSRGERKGGGRKENDTKSRETK